MVNNIEKRKHIPNRQKIPHNMQNKHSHTYRWYLEMDVYNI